VYLGKVRVHARRHQPVLPVVEAQSDLALLCPTPTARPPLSPPSCGTTRRQPMPRGDVPGRGAGLVEIEERIAALEHISERLSERFERLLDLDHVDLADFDLEPASVPSASTGACEEKAAGDLLPQRLQSSGRPVTAEAAVRAVKGLARSKDVARVRVYANTVFCALRFGNIEARATACSVEAAQAVVGLVAKSLLVFEYNEIYNKSRTMSKRDVDQTNVRLRLANPPARPLRCVVRSRLTCVPLGRCLCCSCSTAEYKPLAS